MPNRHLYGETNPVMREIPDSIGVWQGDLMFLVRESAAALRQVQRGVADKVSATTGLVLPLMCGTTYPLTTNSVYRTLFGVAAANSPKGTTSTIAIDTTGVFRFPVAGSPGGVTSGQLAQYSLPPAISLGDYTAGVTENYTVLVASIGGGGGASGCSLGYVVTTEGSSPDNVDVEIRTLAGRGVIVDA